MEESSQPAQCDAETASTEAAGAADNAGGGWYSWSMGLLEKTKDKTWSTLELVKSDLSEFSQAVKEETATIVSATTSTIRDSAPQITNAYEVGSNLMKGLVGAVNTALQIEDTTLGEEELEVPISPNASSRAEARMFFIQVDPGTYLSEPDGAPELYEDWLDHFVLAEREEEMAALLAQHTEMGTIHTQLVPSHIDNATFWQRYFYKMHQFKLDEARRLQIARQPQDDAASSSSWEKCDEDFECGTRSSALMAEFLPAVTGEKAPSTSPTKGFKVKEVDDGLLVSKNTTTDADELCSSANGDESSSRMSDGWASGVSTPAEFADATIAHAAKVQPSLLPATATGSASTKKRQSNDTSGASENDDWVEWTDEQRQQQQ